LGRHVLAECERCIAERIERIAANPGKGQQQQQQQQQRQLDYSSLSDFIKEMETRAEVLVTSSGDDSGMMEVERPLEDKEEESETDIPDSEDKGTEPTLTIREGIKAKKRQRVSETPTQNLYSSLVRVSNTSPTPTPLPGFEVASGGSYFGLEENNLSQRQQHSPRLTNAVVDLALDQTIQFTNHSASDDSRKATPSLTPNQTAQVVAGLTMATPMPTMLPAGLLGSGGKKTTTTAAHRSPWATPGIGGNRERTTGSRPGTTRGARGSSKDSLPLAEEDLQSEGEKPETETQTENKLFGNGEEVGCALNSDDVQVDKSQQQQQQNKKKRQRGVTPSLSSDENSQKVAENLKLSVTPSPSPPLAASS
jgi:hypothetical protein